MTTDDTTPDQDETAAAAQAGSGALTVAADQDIAPVTIEDEMRRSYLDYAMSVIVSRALPDVRDGLKPVHRRILYAMKMGGFDWNRPYRKSSHIVGQVMGSYHPHGDSAIYDAMVRMAQDFSMRLPLVDGQGNFGSMDADPAAAMRYTEARLTKAASGFLEDIDKETVDFQPNYDESTVEPIVLPAQIPNLLVNGAGGIAVGMATNIPPHNLSETIEAAKLLLENPDATIDDLIEVMPGPDFPTGGIIMGRAGIRAGYHTGRGSVTIRAKTHIEEIRKDREAIVVTELPYQVNKARLHERVSECAKEKIIEGIAESRDESDRDGVRFVVELKRDAQADIVLNQLFRHTQMQTTFGINMLAINGGRPELLDVKSVLRAFLDFREEVVVRRTVYLLNQARDRAHVLVGLAVAVANIDAVIHLIRHAPDPATAREQLLAKDWPADTIEPIIKLIDEPDRKVSDEGTYRLSDQQARAILALQLSRLTGLERDKIAGELTEIAAKIKDYLDILGSKERILSIVREELDTVGESFGNARRTQIEDVEADYDIEELIPREDMVVTVSHNGYVKRVPLSTYRAQRRGGKGRSGMSTRDEDFVSQILVCNTHTPVLFFSSHGMAYKLKVFRLPLGTPQARGKPFNNVLPLAPGEIITTFLPWPEDEAQAEALTLMFATSSGTVRRNALSDFESVRANGKIAMKLEEDEALVGVEVCREDQSVLLASRNGKAIRFPVEDVRIFQGRGSRGVRGIALKGDDRVISMAILETSDLSMEERDEYLKTATALRRAAEEGTSGTEFGNLSAERFTELSAQEQFILTVAEDGLGKRSSAFEYRLSGRGGQGITNIELGRGKADDAHVIASTPILETDQIMLVTDGGTLIRTPVHDVRVAGRGTRGVWIFRVADGERIVSVARLAETDEDDGEGDAAAPDEGGDAGPPDSTGPSGDAGPSGEAGSAGSDDGDAPA